MEKVQIREITKERQDAGSKATADIVRIAEEEGFVCADIKQDDFADSFMGRMIRQKGYLRDFLTIRNSIPKGAVVLLQHPFHHRQLTRTKTLKKLKYNNQCKFICIVHDVEELRGYRYNKYYAQEFKTMLELADQIIVHNDHMKTWFQSLHISEEKLINLELFDYLVPIDQFATKGKKEWKNNLIIAGNLDPIRSGYILKLNTIKDIPIHLFGPNCDETLKHSKHIFYHGSYPPEKIPLQLDGGFGLVWDGTDIDACRGVTGEYMKYNNPHKLSLYLAAGLPVVVWNKAAIADIVRSEQIGFCVDNLEECVYRIKGISESQWNEYTENAARIGEKIRRGYYTKCALKTALARLEAFSKMEKGEIEWRE